MGTHTSLGAQTSAHASLGAHTTAHMSAHTSFGAHMSAHTSSGAHTSACMCAFLPREPTSVEVVAPGQEGVDPDVGGHDDHQGEEEDLAVVGGVVDV